MEALKDIANISGKPGLFRILKPTKAGVIVETIDDKKTKTVVGAQARVSVLKDISIYTQDVQEASLPLAEIWNRFNQKYGLVLDIDHKNASERELYEFVETVAPEIDRERVYGSDVKKMVAWYKILAQYSPESFAVTYAEESPVVDTTAEVVGE
jgi:glycerol-3-phosphate cytidylyltransferase-like family protein